MKTIPGKCKAKGEYKTKCRTLQSATSLEQRRGLASYPLSRQRRRDAATTRAMVACAGVDDVSVCVLCFALAVLRYAADAYSMPQACQHYE